MTVPDYKKDLQEFVSVISHDLRGPLRHIKSFHHILMQDIELTEEQLTYKGYVDKAINTLESQLESLLSLSRINTTEVNISTFNVKALIDEIMSAIGDDITNGCQIGIDIDNELNISCDRNRLYQAYFEVVFNAFKFHLPGTVAHVSIQAKVHQDKLIVTIVDKGIGIDEKNYQAIYLPFRCLNHQKEFSGLGMGLTFSQKNIHSINGHIEVVRNAHQGCKFTLIIPTKHRYI